MTSDDPTHEPPSRPDRPRADPAGFPDWLHQLEKELRVSRSVRLRIWCRRRAGRLLAGVGALLALALLTTVGTVGYGYARRPAPKAYPTISQPPGVSATSTASPPPAAGPFDGTPAAAFPAGAAGITLPPAKRTGDFTAKQVSDGLAKVRAALVTARLDRTFMTAKDPDRLVRQLAPDVQARVRKDFASGAFANYATRLAPGARLAPEQPRVKGRITYRATRSPHGVRVLEVTTNFVWAYAFRPARVVPGDGVVVVHDTLVWELPYPGDVRSRADGLWLADMRSYGANVDCAAFDKGLLNIGEASDPEPVVTTTADPDSLYDPDRSLDIPDSCGLPD
ncbi:hypothetical protein [Micromonospora sp. IBHARD004]|uniref:hypothetical protein n=1 Tax=Micromonospora sp. IBHARD004 TaxID=3457764 RepID=UPI00405A176C